MNVKHLWPLAIVVAGIGATAIGAAISHHYWSFFGLLLIISLASMLSGALLGFLFGVPRLNRNYDPREDYGRTTKYLPNTNLEDVSDWLTKIIIGITLTQLAKIPDYLQGIADYVTANSSCAGQDCHLAGPVIVSLLVYFFIAGFLSGYYYTRIFLPTLFSIMEENSILRAETAIWRKGDKFCFQLPADLASLPGSNLSPVRRKQCCSGSGRRVLLADLATMIVPL
jgi:ABC-type amino acid transport system permease subunit